MREIYVECIETGDRGTAQGVAQHLIKHRGRVARREPVAARIITAARNLAARRVKGPRKVYGYTFRIICGACCRGECVLHGKRP